MGGRTLILDGARAPQNFFKTILLLKDLLCRSVKS